MTKQEKEKIRIKLEAEILKTQSALRSYESMTQPVKPENSLGRISRMDAIHNKSITEAALRESQLKIKNLQIMINNIDHASFGLCQKCQKPISIARLLYRPQSRYCIRCAR